MINYESACNRNGKDIEVEEEYDNRGEVFYSNEEDSCEIYEKEDLDFNINDNIDPTIDYWTRLEHQYAGMAMQGMLSNPAFPKHSQDGYYKKNVVNNAYEYAHALVEKYKKEEKK